MRKPLNLFDLKERYDSLLKNFHGLNAVKTEDVAKLLDLADDLLDELSWLHDEKCR